MLLRLEGDRSHICKVSLGNGKSFLPLYIEIPHTRTKAIKAIFAPVPSVVADAIFSSGTKQEPRYWLRSPLAIDILSPIRSGLESRENNHCCSTLSNFSDGFHNAEKPFPVKTEGIGIGNTQSTDRAPQPRDSNVLKGLPSRLRWPPHPGEYPFRDYIF